MALLPTQQCSSAPKRCVHLGTGNTTQVPRRPFQVFLCETAKRRKEVVARRVTEYCSLSRYMRRGGDEGVRVFKLQREKTLGDIVTFMYIHKYIYTGGGDAGICEKKRSNASAK